jgi:sec-independent protein translocase protein TatB
MDFGFFGIGTWELLVIGLIALIVLGPKQMIVMARKAGELLRQFQQIWQEASKTIDREIRVIEEETGSIGSIGKEIQSIAKDVKSAMTINLPMEGDTSKKPATNDRAPEPADPGGLPSEPAVTFTPPSAWTPPPAPKPSPTTKPVRQSSNQPTEQPADASDTQPSAPATSEPETRYPAWTSKPDH